MVRGLPALNVSEQRCRCLGELVAKNSLSTKGQTGWAAIRKQLDSFDRAGLLALVHDLYDASASNRRFLAARLLTSSMSIEKYRRLVADAVYPDPFSRRQVSIRDATAAISEYQRATGDVVGTVDLMLTFVEAGTEQAADLGYGDDPYFAALERKLDTVAKLWPELSPQERCGAAKRLDWLRKRAQDIGYGYGDYVADVVAVLENSSENAKA
jgi:hypothetical protein